MAFRLLFVELSVAQGEKCKDFYRRDLMDMFYWQECWQLRKGCIGVREEDVEFEEELYTAGTVVVWSQGSRTQASNVYKAFTVDSPVQQVGY